MRVIHVKDVHFLRCLIVVHGGGTSTIIDCNDKGYWVDGECIDIFIL